MVKHSPRGFPRQLTELFSKTLNREEEPYLKCQYSSSSLFTVFSECGLRSIECTECISGGSQRNHSGCRFASVLTFALLLPAWLNPNALAAPPKLPRAEPRAVGLDAAKLAKIDELVAEAITAKKMPGCVVLVARHGKVAFCKAYGDRQVEPEQVKMTEDTLFDMASITKPIATATSVMLLVEQGKLRLGDPVAKHIPEFAANGKEKITIEQLLTHQGGLIADNSIKDYEEGPDKAWERLFALKPASEPGTKFVYSDVSFLVLGKLVERVSGQTLAEFSTSNMFKPLGMTETGYLPGEELRRRAAPTQEREGRWMQGEVHDPRAYKLGGVAGHAGLFSTAEDLAVYAQMMLGQGEYAGVRIMKQDTWSEMTKARAVSSGQRGLGWDMQTGYSTNKGKSLSSKAFGHGGFTGTVLWIDPELDLFFIFLSNRVHPSGKGLVNPLAGQIGTIVGEAVER